MKQIACSRTIALFQVGDEKGVFVAYECQGVMYKQILQMRVGGRQHSRRFSAAGRCAQGGSNNSFQ